MAKYRKKPVVIEAIQWDGTNFDELTKFFGGFNGDEVTSEYVKEATLKSGEYLIRTLEGVMTASKNDFIIKGVNGEFYPCKPDIFEKTYEIVL